MKYPDRKFQVWDASPSFQRLLLRSPKTEAREWKENIDIIFFGVKHLDIPFMFNGIEIEDVTESDKHGYVKPLGSEDKIFVLKNQDGQGIIVASQLKILSNKGDIFGSPF